MIDGVVVEGLTVSGGAITLPVSVGAGNKVSFGLPYTVEVETLPVRFSEEGKGSNLGRRQQVGDVVLHLSETSTIEAGCDFDHLYPVRQRSTESYGEDTRLIDGVTEPITMEGKAGTDVTVALRQTKPLPFTLLAVAAEPIING